jgi:hypothetical protein
MTLPKSYKGTSGGGVWKFFLGERDFSVLQARLIGVAYWEMPVGDELHIVEQGKSAFTMSYSAPFGKNGRDRYCRVRAAPTGVEPIEY